MTETLRAIASALGADRYVAHSICLTNETLMIVMYSMASLTIWLSYYVIGTAMLLSYARGVYMGPGTKTLFGAFIFACGTSHFTEWLTLNWGVYRLDIFVRTVTAAVSVATALTTTRAVWEGNVRGA